MITCPTPNLGADNCAGQQSLNHASRRWRRAECGGCPVITGVTRAFCGCQATEYEGNQGSPGGGGDRGGGVLACDGFASTSPVVNRNPIDFIRMRFGSPIPPTEAGGVWLVMALPTQAQFVNRNPIDFIGCGLVHTSRADGRQRSVAVARKSTRSNPRFCGCQATEYEGNQGGAPEGRGQRRGVWLVMALPTQAQFSSRNPIDFIGCGLVHIV